MRIPLTAFAAAALAFGALDAGAQTLYKLIDRNGKVTYVDTPPKDYDGQVIRVEIDPKANTATLPKFTPRPEAEAAKAAPATQEERVRQARERLDAARKAYSQARDNPGPDDVERRGTVKGGSRPVFSDEYQKRLDGLERAVKEAEQELKRAEQGG